jgi:hypothetical protein
MLNSVSTPSSDGRATLFVYNWQDDTQEIKLLAWNIHTRNVDDVTERAKLVVCKPSKFNSSRNASCWQLSKELKTLSVQSQYIFSILLFVIKNRPISV